MRVPRHGRVAGLKPNLRAGGLRHVAMGTGFLLASLIVSISGAEIAFRWYENAFLMREPDAGGREVDLARLGFNDTSVPLRKPPGEFRILSFGDSFAQAIVRYPSTYHGVAAMLAHRATGRNVRIVNLGEVGTTFQHYVRAYAYWSRRLEYDAVIFNTFMGNDLPESEALPPVGDLTNAKIHTPLDTEPVEFRKPLVLVPHRYPLRMLDYLYAHALALVHPALTRRLDSGDGLFPRIYPAPGDHEAVLAIERSMAVTYHPAESPKLTAGYGQLVRLLRLMAEVDAQGKGVLLILSPSQFQVVPRFMKALSTEQPGLDLDLPVFLAQEAVRKVDSRIPVLNLTTAFRCAAANGADLYFMDNTHWNVAGNRLAGISLGRFIVARWLNRAVPDSAVPDRDSCAGSPIMGRIEDRTAGRMEAARVVLHPQLGSGEVSGMVVGDRYAGLAGNGISTVEAGGRVDAVVILDPGSDHGNLVSGRIRGLPVAADGLILGISSGTMMEAVVRAPRTVPGECRFAARLAGHDGRREYHVIAVEEGTLRMSLVQTASMSLEAWRLVREPESGLEVVACQDERALQILPGLVRGRVERYADSGDAVELEGIAAVDGRIPRRTDGILVFADRRLVYRGWTAWERPGLAQAMGAAGTGFRFRISRKFTGDPAVSGIRVFAVISANVVSELRYPAEYPWGGPAGSPSLYTPELKDAILGPAPRPAR